MMSLRGGKTTSGGKIMSVIRRDFLKLMGAAGAATTLPFDASFAAGYPNRPITQVVSTALGGGVDTVARAVSAQMKKNLGNATINSVNKTGGTSSIATKFVFSQPSDGYTWLACPGFDRGLRILNLDTTVPYKDWQYFGCDTSYMSLAVLPNSPIKDLADLLEQGRKKPGGLRMATNGPGGTWYLAALLVERASKASFRKVPYNGGFPAMKACLEGEVDVTCNGLHEQLQFIKSGKLRNLAVAVSEPLDIQGVKLQPITKWLPSLKAVTPIGGGYSMAVKRDTDKAIIKQLADAWMKSVNSKEFQAFDAKKPRFPDPVVGEKADRRAALWDCVASNLLVTAGLNKKSLKELDIPSIEDFDKWWPPKGYKPAI
jgi:tripartite-type tricarboxylate transporter receptor subunit TctC